MILEKQVAITPTLRNYKHYSGLGYNIPKLINSKGQTRPNISSIIVKIEDLIKWSQVKVTKICDDCKKHIPNQKYCDIIKSRQNGDGKDRCLKCANLAKWKKRKENIPYERSLEYYSINNDLFYLIEEFSEKNKVLPSKIYYSTSNTYLWVCNECKSEYYSIVASRTSSKSGCPYCADRKLNDTNSLATHYPALIKEWHPTLNGNTTPYDITKHSIKVVWWKCLKCGSDYDSSVNDKSIKGYKCPYCRGLRVNHTNSLYSGNYDFINEWDFKKNDNLTPHDVVKGSCKKVWWLCSKCNHNWRATISSRTKLKQGCPVCNESKGEKAVRTWLESNGIKFQPQKEFKGLTGIKGRLLSFDFYLPNDNLLIEYQGQYHDGNGNYFVKKNLPKQQEHDRRKREYAKKNNIKLLEIWYWDFDHVVQILEEKLGGI